MNASSSFLLPPKQPDTLIDALKLNELETLLSSLPRVGIDDDDDNDDDKTMPTPPRRLVTTKRILRDYAAEPLVSK